MPMNVLLLMADQHQAACLGHEGHPQVLTPHLDRLAGESVRFRHAYTANPICTPSRVSILSGQYCHNHGYYGLSGPAPLQLPSFCSHFRAQGYVTGGIGNLHTPDTPRNWLADHLDYFGECFESITGEHEASPFYDQIRRLGVLDQEDFHYWWQHPNRMMEGQPSLLPFELSQEGWCVTEAMRFIERAQGRPFCVEVSLERPHQPFYPAQRFWDLYPEDLALPPTIDQDPSGRPPHFRAAWEHFHRMVWATEPQDFASGARRLWRGYLAAISQVDHAVGLLLDYLERSGLAQNTAVIYTADHGGYSGTHGIMEKAPGICSEAVCRVPFLWRVPGVTPAGVVRPHLVQSVDLAPTIAALCGLPPLPSVDGCDLTGLLRGGDDPVREVAVTEHPWSKALRWRQWRFVHYPRELFGGQDVGELYDLEHDPDESRNLYHDPAAHGIVEECRRLLLEWLIRTTRIVTCWPVKNWKLGPTPYPVAGDGKEANTEGAAERVRRGWVHYI